MLEGFRFKGTPAIIPAVVVTSKNAGGQIGVQLEHYTENDYPDPSLPVRVIGSYPKIGSRGLVVFLDNLDENFQNGYWLGSTSNRFVDKERDTTSAEQFESKLTDGTRGMFDDTGNNSVLLSTSEIRIKSKTNELTLSPTGFRVANGASGLKFDQEGFSVNSERNGEVISRFTLNNKQTELYSTGGILLRTAGDINFKATGNVYIGSNSDDNKPISLFHVKSSKIVMESGSGPITFQGSQFNVKIGSSAANQLGTTAASIEVVQGNIDYSTGVGNINIRALSPAHKVKMVNGFLMLGVQSYVEVSGMSAKMGAELVPGLGAYIECSRAGSVKIDALLSVTSESKLKTSIKSMTMMELNALVAMKLETLKMDIIATAMMKVETMMLDLKGAKMIDAGPKVAIPGPGPFCSMPACPILGCMLTGAIAVG